MIYSTRTSAAANLLSKPDGVFSSGWRTGVFASGGLVTLQAATNVSGGSCAATSAVFVSHNCMAVPQRVSALVCLAITLAANLRKAFSTKTYSLVRIRVLLEL